MEIMSKSQCHAFAQKYQTNGSTLKL